MNTSDLQVEHHLEAPTRVVSAWIKTHQGDKRTQLLIEVEFDPELHTSYGAPATAWINYTVGGGSDRTIMVDISLLNKTATRLPEAMFLSFGPPGKLDWSMQKLGSWLRPNETLDGGAKGLHAVADIGLRCSADGGKRQLTVGSLDAALLHWGVPSPFPNPCFGPVDTTAGASYVLFNNMYNTNVRRPLASPLIAPVGAR